MPRKRSEVTSSKRRRWKVADARAILAGLESSGLTLAAFAAREGLKVERLRRWRQRLGTVEKSIAATPAFIEVRRRAPDSVAIVLCSGRMLRVSEAIDAEVLRRIVDALEETA